MQQLTSALKQYAVLSAIYLGIILFLPANKAALHNYNLTSSAYHLLLFLVVLPFIAIWFGAFYSYGRLRQYSDAILNTPEGKYFSTLANGFKWLAVGAAVSAILTSVLNAIADSHPHFTPAAAIIGNYASLLVPLVGYSYISTATRGLNIRAKITITSSATKLLIFSFMLVGVVYCFATFRQLDLHALTSTNNPYYLPAWLMILTLIVPYLFSWFVGLLAAYELYLYSRHTSGVFYQRSLRLLSYGVIAVITSSIVVQYLRTATPRSGHLALNTVLLIINIAFIFMGTGYILVSLGARQLRKIEEV